MLKMAEQSGCCHRFPNKIKAKMNNIFCDFYLPTLYCIPKREFGIYIKVRKKLFFSRGIFSSNLLLLLHGPIKTTTLFPSSSSSSSRSHASLPLSRLFIKLNDRAENSGIACDRLGGPKKISKPGEGCYGIFA